MKTYKVNWTESHSVDVTVDDDTTEMEVFKMAAEIASTKDTREDSDDYKIEEIK